MKYLLIIACFSTFYISCKKNKNSPEPESLAGEYNFHPKSIDNRLAIWANRFTPEDLRIDVEDTYRAKLKLIANGKGEYFIAKSDVPGKSLSYPVTGDNAKLLTYTGTAMQLFTFEKVFNTDSAYYIKSVSNPTMYLTAQRIEYTGATLPGYLTFEPKGSINSQIWYLIKQ